MNDEDTDGVWPFTRIQSSPEALEILQRFWFQISQRRPFKWDFLKMYNEAPDEFDAMFLDIAVTIDKVLKSK